jgi:hypothetical protein
MMITVMRFYLLLRACSTKFIAMRMSMGIWFCQRQASAAYLTAEIREVEI